MGHLRCGHCMLHSWDAGSCVPRDEQKNHDHWTNCSTTYSNKEILKFELILDNNYYTNLKIFHLCFPIRFKKLSNIAYNSDADIYTVNNFFAHWIREINITKYGTNKCLVPTTTPKEIYRYSDSMLKHLPKNALKMIEKDLLYSK